MRRHVGGWCLGGYGGRIPTCVIKNKDSRWIVWLLIVWTTHHLSAALFPRRFNPSVGLLIVQTFANELAECPTLVSIPQLGC